MEKEKISAVYQIKNKVTGERYVGSSVNVFERWAKHKCPSAWKKEPNKKLYQDMQEYGIENFLFAILAPVEPEHLREVEQEFIELLKPTYNSNRANGWDVEKRKASQKAYQQTEKYKAFKKVYQKAYQQTEKYKAFKKSYRQSEKGKAYHKAYNQSEKGKASNKAYRQSEKGKASKKAYANQLCSYNGETLTLCALSARFKRAGIHYPVLEAKKYVIKQD